MHKYAMRQSINRRENSNYLDEHTVLGNTSPLIQSNELLRLDQHRVFVEGETVGM